MSSKSKAASPLARAVAEWTLSNCPECDEKLHLDEAVQFCETPAIKELVANNARLRAQVKEQAEQLSVYAAKVDDLVTALAGDR